METISIINKSGKVVSTTKHLVNIFKDAKDAYNDKKAEIRAESNRAIAGKQAHKMLRAREEVRSEASHSARHHHGDRDRGHRSSSRDVPANLRRDLPHRQALTEHTMSETSSRHGSRHGSRSGSRHSGHRSPVAYQKPYFENAETSRPNLARRHTEAAHMSSQLTLPRSPGIGGGASRFGPPARSMSSPIAGSDGVDMNLAYGDAPPRYPPNPERELNGLMSRLEGLMTEAQCVQHSATTIIAGLQRNPEAMAAVALTLAEISNLVAKMSPGILAAMKSGSPAVFALLASPQFLIAGGLAVGVTVVMFGGYKIVRKLQKEAAERREAERGVEAMVFEPELEVGSIESWRRGIADVEAQSVSTSVDGEFITPEAARQRRERIRERKMEERPRTAEESSRRRERERAVSVDGSERTARRRDIPIRTSSRAAESMSGRTESVSGRTERTESTVKPRKEEKKVKKHNALTVLFKKGAGRDKKGKEKGGSHRQPQMLEL